MRSEAAASRYQVFNNRDQPTELHCSGGSVVLPPRGAVELDEADVNLPQVQALRDRRLITIQVVNPAASGGTEQGTEEEPANEAQLAEEPADQARKQTGEEIAEEVPGASRRQTRRSKG